MNHHKKPLTDSYEETAMKKLTRAVLAAAAAAPAVLTYLTAPGSASKDRKAPFAKRTYAHRGLYKQDQSVPENSMTAFAKALEAGYGIELDLQLSRDGEVVVFHDETLKRLCGVDRPVGDLTFEELKELRLCETDETIPAFKDVLDLVAGRVPLIVEFKSIGVRNDELCEKAFALLDAYDGLYMVESFDPRLVRWFRLNRPDVLRGQLAGPPASYRYKDNMPVWGPTMFGNCLFNFWGRPQFIAYELKEKPLPVRYAEALGAMKVAWTSHNRYMHEGQDAVIFEFYEPETKL